MGHEVKPELSCNNTVCKFTIEKNRKEEVKNKIVLMAGKSPVIFVENEMENNMLTLTVIVASNSKSIKEGLDNLDKEINSVRTFNSGSIKDIDKPVQFKFSKGG